MKARPPLAFLVATLVLFLTGGLHLAAQDEDSPPAKPPAGEEAEPKDDVEPPDDDDAPGGPGEEMEDAPAPPADLGYAEMELLTKAMEIVRQNYVDEHKVGYEDLINSALEGMLSGLDPHCSFLKKRALGKARRGLEGHYEGVGITIANRRTTGLTVVAVREDGPAARAGVLTGDQILKVGDVLTKGMGLTEALGILRGKPGQKLVLTLRRPATKEVLEIELVREVIREETVRDAMILDAKRTGGYKIGYVRLLQFNQPSARTLARELDKLEAEGTQALVFDLRNNPGGLLRSAIDILGEFLPPDTLVLTTEGRDERQEFRTPKGGGKPREYPMVLLVNHGSASGSEVVAGALQDLGRAVVVGTTTFGKGSVQSIIPLASGAALRVTTAKYYTPSRKTIHEQGVSPNIVSSLTPSEERLLAKWRMRKNLSEEERRPLAKFNDRQLERAIDVLKGILLVQKVKPPAAKP